MANLAEIEQKTTAYADSRENLNSLVWMLNEKIAKLKDTELPEIRAAAEETANRKQELHAALSESKGLFLKPKTLIIMGIKVGFVKAKGTISWDSAEMVVKRIKALFTDSKERDLYIKTTEKPSKKTLQDLSAATLKKLGCTMSATGEEVVIAPTSNEIDKLVDALLNNKIADADELEEAA